MKLNLSRFGFVFFVAIMFVTSCQEPFVLKLDKHNITTDFKGKTIVINANSSITSLGFSLVESDSGVGIEYREGDTFFCEGDWFKLSVNWKEANRFYVSLDENNTGKDRCVKVEADRKATSDFVLIVQKPEIL